jgi:RNA polymerase sigma factor (sigma-70 family)
VAVAVAQAGERRARLLQVPYRMARLGRIQGGAAANALCGMRMTERTWRLGRQGTASRYRIDDAVEGPSLTQPTAPSRSDLWSALLAERGRAQRVARARCSSPQDAEDCVQEALARVVAMPDVDLRRVGPLLSVIVANLAADTHRSRGRALKAEPRLVAAGLAQPSPEEEVCDALEARWLWDMRTELPDQDRAVLELRAHGHTAGQAAEALGVTYKAAESAYTRARTRMRAIWRAAAALFGILWGRPVRESAPVAVPVAASVAVALLAVLGVVVPADDGQANPGSGRPLVEAGRAEAAVRAVPQVQAARRPVRPAPAPSAARPAPRDPPSPAAAPIRLVPQSSAGPAYVTGVRVGEERPEESVTETVERCLREGVIVTPSHVDCAG